MTTPERELDELALVRRSYQRAVLTLQGLSPDERDDPLLAVRRWIGEALGEEGEIEATVMTLATVEDVAGALLPDARAVLCKGVDHGLVFYTSRHSSKGRQLARNPFAAAAFTWTSLERQLRVRGRVEVLDEATDDAYFATRPRGSQLSAWASEQSEPIAGRDALDARVEEVATRFADRDVPRPPHWGGYRLVPDSVELWQGRPDRLHDRLQWQHTDDGWTVRRLQP